MSAVSLLFYYYCAVLYSGQQKHVKTQVNKKLSYRTDKLKFQWDQFPRIFLDSPDW